MLRSIIGVILLLLLVGAGGWWYYTTTPDYSLWQLSRAVKEHNEESFRHYFDVRSVASNAVDDLLSEPVRNAGGFGLLERMLGAAAVGWLQPVIVSRLEGSIINYVETNGTQVAPAAEPQERKGILGALVAVLKPPPLSDVLRGLGFTTTNFRGTSAVERSDKVAHSDLLFERKTGAPVTRVQMELKQQPDNSWRVVRFSNLPDVAAEACSSP
ncbi:MAG: hypothetical protein K2W95_31765 [Candidatus Obscuribacterales bacterium]|nr:hypothetical protein [Candidatus Obscuribacterales bacterium]